MVVARLENWMDPTQEVWGECVVTRENDDKGGVVVMFVGVED